MRISHIYIYAGVMVYIYMYICAYVYIIIYIYMHVKLIRYACNQIDMNIYVYIDIKYKTTNILVLMQTCRCTSTMDAMDQYPGSDSIPSF